jgi:pimeloyl-ACP methyl ester carboxylesterase
VNDVNLYYEIHGEGFPFVLAHGYCASTKMWRHQIPVFSQKYQVIAYDARGHGLSTAPSGKEHYSLERLVEDLHGLLRQLDAPEAYIAGHSMGGATAIGFAARHPEMTRAALICNIDGGHQPPDPPADAEAEEVRRQTHRLVRERGLVDYARNQIATQAAPGFVLADGAEQEFYAERYARQSLHGYFGVGEALPWRDAWLRDAARSLTLPVFISAGTDDPMHLGAELLHETLPQSHFLSVRDAPHDTMNARPEAFNGGLLDYLANLEKGSPVAGRREV